MLNNEPRSPQASDEDTRGTPQRIVAVDALRGFTMFWIIGGDSLAKSLAMIGKDSLVLLTLAKQLTHAEWIGFHFYDAIFPTFLFLVGVSIVLSLDRLVADHGRRAAFFRIVYRSSQLFALGVLYSGGITRQWPDVSLAGVLQRIALCYLVAASLYLVLPRWGITTAIAGCLIGYNVLLSYVPYPDLDLKHATVGRKGTQADALPIDTLLENTSAMTAGQFVEGKNLTHYVDLRWLPGKKRNLYYTNEGLLSTIPAVATTLFGILAGWVLKSHHFQTTRKGLLLLTVGLSGIVLGYVWGEWAPIIKRIWTPSYCLVASGYASTALGLFTLVIDVWQWRRWSTPFLWIGANALALYILVNLIDCETLAMRFVGGDLAIWLDKTIKPGSAVFLNTLVALALPMLFARFLYQRKLFIRL